MQDHFALVEFCFDAFFALVFVGLIGFGLVLGRMPISSRFAVRYQERPTVFLGLLAVYACAAYLCVQGVLGVAQHWPRHW